MAFTVHQFRKPGLALLEPLFIFVSGCHGPSKIFGRGCLPSSQLREVESGCGGCRCSRGQCLGQPLWLLAFGLGRGHPEKKQESREREREMGDETEKKGAGRGNEGSWAGLAAVAYIIS